MNPITRMVGISVADFSLFGETMNKALALIETAPGGQFVDVKYAPFGVGAMPRYSAIVVYQANEQLDFSSIFNQV